MKVHYRWHPYFGQKVRIRQVQERADGRYVRVQDPGGIVVLMASWMLDPLLCAAMTVGPPRVDYATLIELGKLLIDARLNKVSSEETTNVQEEHDEIARRGVSAAGSPPAELDVRLPAAGGIEHGGPEQSEPGLGAYLDAGSRPHRRGARR
jgi:hypothetical protein